MKKYWAVFKTSWQEVLTYRFNFLMGRLRSIIVLILLYYIWIGLAAKSGSFAGYTTIELTTYVFGATILKSLTRGPDFYKTAQEINEGIFAKYLCMPLNFPVFVFFRELAERVIFSITSIFEIIFFVLIVRANIFFQTDGKILLFFAISVSLANILYFILSFLMNLMAFWSREAQGPAFLFKWTLEFTSGEFYPLNIVWPGLFLFLTFLPFAYILFYPMMIYLGKLSEPQIFKIFGIQILWIIGFGFLTYFVWKKGLKKYSGEGI